MTCNRVPGLGGNFVTWEDASVSAIWIGIGAGGRSPVGADKIALSIHHCLPRHRREAVSQHSGPPRTIHTSSAVFKRGFPVRYISCLIGSCRYHLCVAYRLIRVGALKISKEKNLVLLARPTDGAAINTLIKF